MRRRLAKFWFPPLDRPISRDELALEKSWSYIPGLLGFLGVVLLFIFQLSINSSIRTAALHNSFVCKDGEIRAALKELESVSDVTAYLFGECENREAAVFIKKEKVTGTEDRYRYDVLLTHERGVQKVLESTPSTSIPLAGWLTFVYLGMFTSAVAAFILMGLRDYLQRELGYTDEYLIRHPWRSTTIERFEIAELPGIYYKVEFASGEEEIISLEGPFCNLDGNRVEQQEGTLKWRCWDQKIKKFGHTLFDKRTPAEVYQLSRQKALEIVKSYKEVSK